MATTAGFKQQCPSCEAWVPIRDMNLVGRKIDCPKCKYRFGVEAPGAESEVEEDVETPKPPKRPRRGEEDVARKGAAVKGKAGPRRRGEDEDEDEGQAFKRKQSGGSSKLILGVGLGVVALVLLAVVGLYMSGVFDSAPAPKTTPTVANRPAQSTQPEPTPQPNPSDKSDAKTTPVAAASADALNNLLPPDTEGVCNVRMRELLRTSLGRTIFETPGAFRDQALSQRLGFRMNDIDQLLQAWSFTQNWSFSVLHGTRPFQLESIKAALRLKPAPEGKIEDQEYFILEPNPWLDNLGRMTFALILQADPLKVPA